MDDINLGMADLAEKNKGEGESYSDGTRRQYLRTVEDFGQARDIDALSDIDVPSVKQGKIDEEWVLDKDEVWDLIDAADKPRTKAVIAVCWECAWRATALMSLRVKDYEEVNDEYGLLSAPTDVVGDKGAGGDKKPVTVARGYLDNWLHEHPRSDNPDAALFCRTDKQTHYGEHMSSEAVRRQLKKAAKDADIDEDRVHVHCFRHARVTYMKKSPEYDDMDIEHTLDWAEGSNQMKRYSHVTQDDKIASVLQARGIEAESGTVEPELQDCPRCGRQIPYDARNCPYCSVRVDEKPAGWYQLYSKLLIDPENDPLHKKYAGMSGTTPTMQRLPREQFSWVNAVFRSFLVERVGLGDPPGSHDEIMEIINIENLPEEAIEKVKHLILSTSFGANYQHHQADYELAENEEFTEWLREGYDIELTEDSNNPLKK
ncbi:site-specific integrase [Halapricum hydrolyticum]|uniref:Tyrosine-type recombinase/integrase n=1 Tax=Halapricum hydrolyticum TaxID=2979991 RepID=A0AAE3LEV2_9EURY|nr:site-specific integrase [Halapricum hydrolyticum]MCU4717600.1 tyrosine-type recombinase/integrase [Halapricum hydrolyticum]MCU4726871.1 tyrosine-type recombinase/integrase [Halapricum hydrolyticum]